MTHKIELPRQSMRILVAALQRGEGWCDTVKLYSAAGSLLDDEVISSFIDMEPPKEGDKESFNKWLQESYEIEVTEGQRNAIQACLRHSVKNSFLPVNAYTLALIKALKLDEE